MKKIISLSFIAFLLILSGCKTAESGNPKQVLTQFLTAISKKDVTEAKKFATADSDGMLTMMSMGLNNMQGNEHQDQMTQLVQNAEIAEPVVKGDNATINVKDKKSGESVDFLLKKEKGSWKVAFDMATLTGMAMKKMKEHGVSMDSLQKGINKAMDSLHAVAPEINEKMGEAQKMMDSAQKLLNEAKEKNK